MGYPIAGFYDEMPLTQNKILVPDCLPEELESAIIEHEKAHHEQHLEPKIYWTTKISWIGIIGLIPAVYLGSKTLTASLVTAVTAAILLERFYVAEKDANSDIDWEEVSDAIDAKPRSNSARYFEYILYVVLVIPGNIEQTLRGIFRKISGVLDAKGGGDNGS